MTKIIIGFVGPMVSGKGTASEYLKSKYNAEVYRFSTILRQMLDLVSLPHSRENLQNLSSALRQTFGDDLLAKAIAQQANDDSNQIMVIDGIRRQPDIKYLQDLPNFYLVEITADLKNRYQRVISRTENSDDAHKTLDQFRAEQHNEAESQIQEVAKNAKYQIDNNGSFEDLYRQVDEIVVKIRNTKS